MAKGRVSMGNTCTALCPEREWISGDQGRKHNLYAEYIMRNARLEEAQARIKIAGRNITNYRYAGEVCSNENLHPCPQG